MRLGGDFISFFLIESYHYRWNLFLAEKFYDLKSVFQKKDIRIVHRSFSGFFMGQEQNFHAEKRKCFKKTTRFWDCFFNKHHRPLTGPYLRGRIASFF